MKDLQRLADQLDQRGCFELADRIDGLLAQAADISDLLQINLQKLRKDTPKDPEVDPRAFYEGLQQQAHEGPIFSRIVLESLHNFPDDLLPNQAKPYIRLLAQTIQEYGRLPDYEELRSIRDFVNANGLPPNASLTDLRELSEEWHAQLAFQAQQEPQAESEEDDEVVYAFPDGFKIVNVHPGNLDYEGALMGHCVGSYCDEVNSGATTIYSLRDPQNKPHVTIEVTHEHQPEARDEEAIDYEYVQQIQGKENRQPRPKYRHYINEWLSKTDFTKDPNEMWKLLDPEKLIQYLDRPMSDSLMKGRIAQSAVDPEVLTHIINNSMPTAYVMRLVAKNPALPKEFFQQIADNADPRVVTELAANPSAPSEILTQLAEHRNANVLKNVAKHKKTPPEVLKALYLDNNAPTVGGGLAGSLHNMLASNPNMPPEILSEMVNDVVNVFTYANSAAFLAYNPKTPPKDLARLFKLAVDKQEEMGEQSFRGHPYSKVLGNFPYNPGTPPNLLHKIAEHMLGNKFVDPHALQEVARRTDAWPQTLQMLYEASKGEKSQILTHMDSILSRNPAVPETIIRDMVVNAEPHQTGLLANLIRNPATPRDVLKQLATHPDPAIQRALQQGSQ